MRKVQYTQDNGHRGGANAGGEVGTQVGTEIAESCEQMSI